MSPDGKGLEKAFSVIILNIIYHLEGNKSEVKGEPPKYE